MKGLEALKRIRQETCPATYMSDFDKNEYCDIIEKELKALEIIKKELVLEVKEDDGLYRLITYQTDNHLIRKDQYNLLKEVLK